MILVSATLGCIVISSALTFLIGDKKGGRKELNMGTRNNNITEITRNLNLITSPSREQ
jgi:hypothetical protein